jgi:hypothetical protein
MHLIEFPSLNIKRYVPRELADCDSRQYIEMAALIYYFQSGQIDYEEFRVHAIYKLLDMKAVNQDKEDIDKCSEVYRLSELIDTFFETKDKLLQIKQYYIHNPVPKIRGGYRNFYGPLDEFNKVTFGEYVDALEEFINFNDTGEIIYLHRLMAVMYRKRKLFTNSDDKRQEYNPDEITKRAKQFEFLHIGVVYGFYLLFASYQKYISTAKIFIQGNEIDLSILFSNNLEKSDSELPGLGMKGVLLNIAESGVYGDESGVRRKEHLDVLIKIYDITKRQLDEAAAYKKANK